MVSVAHLVRTYRQGDGVVRALAGVTFDVPRGQFLAIMGPSGSGKSTLLHLLGGLDHPDSGGVRIGDHDLMGLTDDELTLLRRRTVGFVFQFFNLLPTLTAEENVALPLLLDGAPRRKAYSRARRLLELVALDARADHRPDQLSGGEMQRVAIARALICEPLLVLADEPTGNLDSTASEGILSLLREVGAQLGHTIVMVTHDRRAAVQADRIITLRDGSVVADEQSRA
jgi:putative ABC transport system ATP-binding protein